MFDTSCWIAGTGHRHRSGVAPALVRHYPSMGQKLVKRRSIFEKMYNKNKTFVDFLHIIYLFHFSYYWSFGIASHMMAPSIYRDYFISIIGLSDKVQCKVEENGKECGEKISSKKASNLQEHLQNKHSELYATIRTSHKPTPQRNQMTLTNFTVAKSGKHSGPMRDLLLFYATSTAAIQDLSNSHLKVGLIFFTTFSLFSTISESPQTNSKFFGTEYTKIEEGAEHLIGFDIGTRRQQLPEG